jgi:hypothetical protein
MPYRLDESTGIIDYDMLEKTATLFRCRAGDVCSLAGLAVGARGSTGRGWL